MCKEVWTDEWSGMLFYETEGQFGQDDFKIIAQELFPLDIGSQAYTEYETNDPELIKFLMANPHVRNMKKGHIHSHNNMGVFFSSTDDGELQDNCGHHNFYFSLIVNNRNEMCAKIAFKATAVSETKTVLTFKDQKGADVSKTYKSDKASECIYVYKCGITAPHGAVEDSFKSRFQELKTDKEKKEAARKTSQQLVGGTHRLFQEDDGYREAGLFDDLRGSGGYPPMEKIKQDRMFPYTQSPESKMDTGKQGSSVVERGGRLGLVNDKAVYSMLGKLLAQDHLYEGTLTHIIRKMDNEFYVEDGLDPSQSVSSSLYYSSIEKRVMDFYIEAFPEDQKLLNFNKIMDKCVSILQIYENDYPHIIGALITSLNLEVGC